MPLSKEDLLNLFIKASKLMSQNSNRCRNLIYVVQKSSNEPIIREPEITFILADLLNQKNIPFSLECPTKKRYLISSSKPDFANTDLAIEPNGEQINIEFKEGQAKPKEIEKDILKLLREPVSGSAFFHLLKNTNSKTLPRLLSKFENSFQNLIIHNDIVSKWFIFFIYVKKKKEWFYRIYDDITKLNRDSFDVNKLENCNI